MALMSDPFVVVDKSFWQNKADTLYTRYIRYIRGIYVSAFTKSLKRLPNAADDARKSWQLIKEKE
jgi:hypothetical protein